MKPTEILSLEHRVIEQVLDCLEALAGAFDAKKVEHLKALDRSIYFLKNFADRCHHGKEEAQLFPAMESKGFSPEQGPTSVMRHEHIQGRGYIQVMEECLIQLHQNNSQDQYSSRFRQSANDYIFLLRSHIQKEDHCLFPMADQALSAEEQAQVLRAFHRVEKEEMPSGLHEECLKIADDLAAQFQIKTQNSAKKHSCCGH